jgi:hypothetical protein
VTRDAALHLASECDDCLLTVSWNVRRIGIKHVDEFVDALNASAFRAARHLNSEHSVNEAADWVAVLLRDGESFVGCISAHLPTEHKGEEAYVACVSDIIRLIEEWHHRHKHIRWILGVDGNVTLPELDDFTRCTGDLCRGFSSAGDDRTCSLL